jgi:hypothetical protein
MNEELSLKRCFIEISFDRFNEKFNLNNENIENLKIS